MAFHVGQKVVCVDANPGRDDWREKWAPLERGAIYQIRAIVEGYNNITGYGPGLCFQEMQNPISPKSGVEFNYMPSRFRPLTERKANMEARNSLFRKWERHKEKRVTAPVDEQA